MMSSVSGVLGRSHSIYTDGVERTWRSPRTLRGGPEVWSMHRCVGVPLMGKTP